MKVIVGLLKPCLDFGNIFPGKSTFALLVLGLSGCGATYFQAKPYLGKSHDPLLFVQSKPDISGSIPNQSGTTFGAIYPGEEGICQWMFVDRLQSPVDEQKLRGDIDQGKGVQLPADTFVSVSVRFSQKLRIGSIVHDAGCPEVIATIFTKVDEKYLFEFSAPYGQCNVSAYRIGPDLKREVIAVSPKLMCKMN